MVYPSIEKAVREHPDCTHVMQKSESRGDTLFTTFAPVYLIDGGYRGSAIPGLERMRCELKDGWVVAYVNGQQPTTDQRVTAARFDQAASEAFDATPQSATDRQIGGDHYKSLKIQPIEYIDANNMPYLEGNVVKYVTRHASKNGVQDIDKAIHYLELIKQMRYAEDNTSDK